MFALLAFLTHVVKKRGIAGEIEQSHLTIAIGIEGGLEAAQRERRVREHFAAPLQGFFFQIGKWHHGVNESHIERLLSIVLTAEIPNLTGFFLTNDARQITGTESAIERANFGSRLAKTSVIGSDGEIANNVQHVTATDRISSDHGHDGLGQAADFFLQIQYVQARHAVITDVASMAADFLVTSRAKGEITFTSENDHANLRVLVCELEGLEHFHYRLGPKGIAHFRAIDRNFSDLSLINGLVSDVFEFSSSSPHGASNVYDVQCFGNCTLIQEQRNASRSLELIISSGLGHDGLGARKFLFELRGEPSNGIVVTVNQERFLRFYREDVVEQFLAGGVAREIEIFDVAEQRHGGESVIEFDQISTRCPFDASAWRGGISIADEVDRVFAIFHKALRGEGVRDGVFGHHAAGEGIDAARIERNRSAAFAIADLEVHVFENLKVGKVATRAFDVSVVDHRHLGAESADVDGGLAWDEFLFLELVNHGQQLLGLADGKNRNENGAAAFDHGAHHFGKLGFLGFARVVSATLLGTTGGLNDQRIDGILWHDGTLEQGVAGKVEVAGVEDFFSFCFHGDAHGAKNVSGIVKRAAHGAGFVHIERALVATLFKSWLKFFQLLVGEKRILGDTEFDALAAHHVDRVMKHSLCQIGSSGGHVNRCTRVATQQ